MIITVHDVFSALGVGSKQMDVDLMSPIGGSNALCTLARRAAKPETEVVVVFIIDIFMYLWLLGSVL